jgi:hypothetical protein
MQGKAQVKLANRAIRLCDDPVGEKILSVAGGWLFRFLTTEL